MIISAWSMVSSAISTAAAFVRDADDQAFLAAE
jgi:hypothetical protein